MNSRLKWKLTAGFLLVFIAGALTGALISVAAARHFYFFEAHHEMFAAHMRERLQSELKLTPEQMAKIGPIIDRTGAQLDDIRSDTARRVHAAFAQAHNEMSVNLNEEQRARLERMRQRHEQWLHHTHSEGPPGPPPP